MKSIIDNNNAVSTTLAYILFSTISLTLYMIVLLNANDLLIIGPSKIVVNDQYRDIGNMISTKITDMYLIAPENGYIETEYIIPLEIGKENYMINADQANTDETIEVKSTASEKSVSVTMNGIASSMPINGTAYSTMSNHRISYDSRR